MRLSSRSSDDADLIRARLRTVLEQARRPPGWVPDDDPTPSDDPYAEPDLVDVDDPADDPADELPAPAVRPDRAEPARHRAPATAVRVDPGRRGVWAVGAAGLVAALVLVVWTWLDRPRVAPAPAPARSATSTHVSAGRSAPPSRDVGEAAATSKTVVVSVVGLVARPGLVTLPSGSRVADAVAAAGGLRPEAEPGSVNLAAIVADGQQIAVGLPAAVAGASAPSSGGAPASGPVNLNSATVADLDALPGVGPVLAQRIIDYRTQQGRFTSVDQLDDVPGIGPALYARLAGSVTV